MDGYLDRMKGQRFDPSVLKCLPAPPSRFAVLLSSFIGSFVGIAIVSSLTFNAQWFIERNVPVMAGSFGASAVLIYGAIEAPLSQPRNVIGGHIMSSIIAVSLYKLFNLLSPAMFVKLHWLLCSLAVSISLFAMQVTHTVHPPASATALIAVSGGSVIYDLGYWYVLCPIALGVALMLTVAMIVNNVARRYPTHWWNPKERRIVVIDQDMSTALADFTNPEDDEEDSRTDVDVAPEGVAAGTQGRNIQVEGAGPKTEAASLHPEHQQQHERPQSPHSQHSHPQHPHQHQHHGQFAVYYGGDRNEALKEGEKLQQSSRSRPSMDLERGQSARRTSILMEMRGELHSSASLQPEPSRLHYSLAAAHNVPAEVSIATTSSVTEDQEEEYRRTIEQLRQRVRELEQQIGQESK